MRELVPAIALLLFLTTGSTFAVAVMSDECGEMPRGPFEPRDSPGLELRWPHSKTRLIVGLRRVADPEEAEVLHRRLIAVLTSISHAMSGAPPIAERNYLSRIQVSVLEIAPPGGDEALQAIAMGIRSQAADIVEYIELDSCVYAEPTLSVGEVTLAEVCEDQWALGKIDAASAWLQTKGSRSIVVAVIDKGIDTTHPDLAKQLWDNPCEIYNKADDECSDHRKNDRADDLHGWNFVDGNEIIDSSEPHGTEMGGVIGSIHDNHICGDGVLGKLSLMMLKALEGESGHITNITAALDYAVVEGATVVNTSFSSRVSDASFVRALGDANARGVLIVTAAGNNGVPTDLDSNPSFPCSYKGHPNLICVTGTNPDDSREATSSFGDETVHLGAPGAKICAASAAGSCATKSAVSLAVPFVTGVVGLIRAKCPTATVCEVVERIKNGGDSALFEDTIWEKRLNAGGALAGACWTSCPPP